MKRILLGVVLVLFVAIGGALYYLVSTLDSLVKSAIETYGSEMTGTAVRVDSVRIELVAGKGTIRGLTIANPAGFSTAHAFTLGEITLDIDPGSVTGNPVVIDEIAIRAPQVTYEMNAAAQSNLLVIQNNLSAYSGDGGGGGSSDATASDDAAETRLSIKRFVFEKGQVTAHTSAVGGKDGSLRLPPLRMNDLGGKQGMTGAELGKKVLSAYTTQVVKAVGSSQIGRLLDDELGDKLDETLGKEGADAAKDLLKKVFN
jgi:hypothetical protein